MNTRQVKDYLHDEYYDILPKLRLISKNAEIQIKHALLPIFHDLKPYERIEVSVRIKDVESAIEKLRSKQESKIFDEPNPSQYSIRNLKDLIGIRIAYLPSTLKDSIWRNIIEIYPLFKKDTTIDYEDQNRVIIEKLYVAAELDDNINIEIQFLPLLFCRFLDIEHDLIYKPNPKYSGIKRSLVMRKEKSEVLNKLSEFENAFLEIISESQK